MGAYVGRELCTLDCLWTGYSTTTGQQNRHQPWQVATHDHLLRHHLHPPQVHQVAAQRQQDVPQGGSTHFPGFVPQHFPETDPRQSEFVVGLADHHCSEGL